MKKLWLLFVLIYSLLLYSEISAQNVGEYKLQFHCSTFASGVYFYQLKAGDFVETKKMILIK